VEATLFALLMSIVNLAGLLSHEFGAVMTYWLGVTEAQFDHLWILVLITNLTTLLPLPLLFLLPEASSQGTSASGGFPQGATDVIVPQLQPIAGSQISISPIEGEPTVGTPVIVRDLDMELQQ
jgi:hypothetical protein